MQSLSGTCWTLAEAYVTDPSGQHAAPAVGHRPIGITRFDADRMIVVLADAREAASPRALVAYTGRYRFDGAELVTEADAASAPGLVTPQIRDVRFEGARMVVTPKAGLPGSIAATTYVWERVG